MSADDPAEYRPKARRPRCTRCREPIQREGNPHFPFCSEQCKLLDLSSWFNEEYRLPAPVTERDLPDIEEALQRASSEKDD